MKYWLDLYLFISVIFCRKFSKCSRLQNDWHRLTFPFYLSQKMLICPKLLLQFWKGYLINMLFILQTRQIGDREMVLSQVIVTLQNFRHFLLCSAVKQYIAVLPWFSTAWSATFQELRKCHHTKHGNRMPAFIMLAFVYFSIFLSVVW